MRDPKRRWKSSLFGSLIVLCGWALPANAGLFQGSGTTNLGAEFSAFLSDFGPWNASHNNMPLLFLEMTPQQEQGDAFLLLWWLWMQSQGNAHSSPPSMAGGSPPTSSVGGLGGHTAEPPIGTIGSGSNGNDPPPNTDPSNPPSTGTVGSGPNGNDPSTPILTGGNGSQGNGGTPPVILPTLNPPSQGLGNGPSMGGQPPSTGGSVGALVSPSIAAVPEPSSLALLGSGALGMLTYGWGRWRTARRGTGAR